MSDLPPPILGFFEDADPEDAWAAGDSVEEQLRVIGLCLKFIIEKTDIPEIERVRRLRSISDSVEFVNARVALAIHELRGIN